MFKKKVWLLFIVFFVCTGLVREIDTVNAAGAGSLKLGVNDKLTEIEAVSIKDTYFVPLRDLSLETNLVLTLQGDGINVKGNNGSIKLLNDHATALLPNGKTIALDTLLKNGRTMVPVKMTSHLGFSISFKPAESLLRIHNSGAKLNDATFVNQHKKALQPNVTTGTTGTKGKVVYLSFDDGPSATTSQLLDILAKYDAKATFFMLGNNMNAHASQVKRLVKEGHAPGLHGMTHVKDKFYASPASALKEMNDDNAILKKLTGQSTTLIRTPYGSKPYLTKPFRDKVLTQGYHLWDWNVDSEDWRYKNDSNSIYNTVMREVHGLKKSSPVILMHDQKATLKVLPRILATLKKEGYEFHIITSDMTPNNFWKDHR
ncbi:polysaccharide deacetylase family protein [Paenibacillus sp.]|uniref:polysaccharide deacetylase n=1 Tax=Paenibacillus sp. TaxID=58172 RepID=UPI0028A9D03E|nr:polysaccharide deacetylase family protein [Paenibacillus sp.]